MFRVIVDNWSKTVLMEEIHVGEVRSEYYVVYPDSHQELILSLPKHLIIAHVHGMFMRTFPTVLERLGV